MNYTSRGDIISVTASIVCAIHCILLPIFFSTLPLLGIELIENVWIEFSSILVAIIVGGRAIYKGYIGHHRNILIVFLFLHGIVIFLICDFLPAQVNQVLIKLLGAICIIAAHIYNWHTSKNQTISSTRNTDKY